MLLGKEETGELMSDGVSGGIEKSWSIGIMGVEVVKLKKKERMKGKCVKDENE